MEQNTFKIKSNNFTIEILESGNIKEIRDDIVRINTYCSNNFEQSINNLFIRIKENGKYIYAPMIGVGSNSKFYVNEKENYCIYKGSFKDIQYHIILRICENACLFDVTLCRNEGKKAEIFYGMDVGINNIYALSNNEAYVSQYIDHYVYHDENGYTILSRQNQGGGYFLETSSLTNNVSYSTDGFDFFKTSYKETNRIKALEEVKLANRIYQYEFSYIALQSEELSLDKEQNIVFYFAYQKDIYEKIETPVFKDKLIKNYHKLDVNDILDKENLFTKKTKQIEFNEIIKGENLDINEINKLYPEQLYIEKEGESLSFFTKDYSNVITNNKEILFERPSGNIIISLNEDSEGLIDFENVITNTSYIYGVFLSQIAIGNTSFNKLLTNQRNPLNLCKISGIRVLIKEDDQYKILTMPSLFEMGLNYFIWYYKYKEDILVFKVFTSIDKTKIEFSFSSKKNKEYDLLITNNLVMGERDNENYYSYQLNGSDLIVDFDPNGMIKRCYPNLQFKINLDKEFELTDFGENLLGFKLKNKEFNYLITNTSCDSSHLEFFKEKEEYRRKFNNILRGFDIKSSNSDFSSLNILTRWYLHDGLIHYASPHGLEQYSGAAWGLRDVCQGPAELFLSLGNYKEVRRILNVVYSHQFLETGDFPQWFMFDNYYQIQDLSSHGDIIVWPMRLLAMYLEETRDYSILDEIVPYTKKDGVVFTNEDKIINHLDYEIKAIEASFLKGTHLPIYGGGDWDDTLQPANSEYKKEMISGWTPILLYEALIKLSKVMDTKRGKKYSSLAYSIKKDYMKYVMKEDIPSGSIRIKDDVITNILHPTDKVTNIKYRLLPFTRSIISEFVNYKDAVRYSQIIKDNMLFSDGVRLMSSLVPYNGGIKKYFNRAETASNFGREIGLMYSHANIRYADAMANLGCGDEVYESLQKINPIIIKDINPNSVSRQRISYFSSSDACFINRYDAMANFDKLKENKIQVKGGWRVYSSGPGIYISTLIKKMLGINVSNNKLVISPVISNDLLDFSFKYQILDKDIIINYKLGEPKLLLNGKKITSKTKNKYHKISYLIDINELNEELNTIDVWIGEEDNTKKLIEDEIKGSFDFFWNESNTNSNVGYGLTSDKIYLDYREEKLASIASIGFALASYVIGVERGYISFNDGYERCRKTLETLKGVKDFHGFLPHFINQETGLSNGSEFSTIDTAILLMGAITAGNYFKDEVLDLSNYLYERCDWNHFIKEVNGKKQLIMAYSEKYWKDNNGYCPACWDHYAEQLMIYLLIGGRRDISKDLAKELFNGFTRHYGKYKGREFVYCYANPLFVHQFTHCFFDFNKYLDCNGYDWFRNSVDATLANRRYSLDQKWSKTFGKDSWGLSAFEGKDKYLVYGSKPQGFPNIPFKGKIEGYVTPYAALASINFTPKESIRALKYFNKVPGLKQKYGLTDSYNFDIDFVSDAYIGIDKGPTIIMLDNYLYKTTWKYFMESKICIEAIKKLDFKERK